MRVVVRFAVIIVVSTGADSISCCQRYLQRKVVGDKPGGAVGCQGGMGKRETGI
jgi:hypothetical protein